MNTTEHTYNMALTDGYAEIFTSTAWAALNAPKTLQTTVIQAEAIARAHRIPEVSILIKDSENPAIYGTLPFIRRVLNRTKARRNARNQERLLSYQRD